MAMKGTFAWGLMAGVIVGAALIGASPNVASADASGPACAGTKEDPCPLQKWMRQNMASANSSGDMAALQTAFTKLATMSPDPSWNGGDAKANWDAISKAGLAAAKANDVSGVKLACKCCHDVFKQKYKDKFRTKAVP
jgi:hypothetical protein